MPSTDFERNDGIDQLTSEELERAAFDDPTPIQRSSEAAVRPQADPRPTKFCHACGKTIDREAEMCVGCGVRQTSAASAPSAVHVNVNSSQTMNSGGGHPQYALDKSKVAAGVLALLLGGLGAHKFYLGKVIQGFLYLVFCWTFIPSAIAFIEGILYLVSSDEAFARKYGSRVY